jgi:hypothetical protein
MYVIFCQMSTLVEIEAAVDALPDDCSRWLIWSFKPVERNVQNAAGRKSEPALCG